MLSGMSQLAAAPLFILMVIASICNLIFLRKEKGCVTAFLRVGAVIYIVVYLIAVYSYIF